MSQTKEDRIYKHYKSEKRGHFNFHDCYYNDDKLILWLAKRWKMKCIEIKNIVRARQTENKADCHHYWVFIKEDIDKSGKMLAKYCCNRCSKTRQELA